MFDALSLLLQSVLHDFYGCHNFVPVVFEDMVKKITAEVGHINVLVSNAGIIKRIPMIEMTAAQFRQVINVDLNAPLIVARAV